MFAAIYIPDFPVEAIVRAEPELREHAVAVVEGAPPLVQVIAINEKAAQAGIEPGMTKLQAEERLVDGGWPMARSELRVSTSVQKQRGGVIRQRSPEREAAAHAALLDCACGFSPRVEDTAADTIVADLAGLERVFGPAAKLARDMARRCSELGLEANVAVASNADTAVLAARGFAGVTVVAEGKEAERLGELSVEVLVASDWGKAWPIAERAPTPSKAASTREGALRQAPGRLCATSALETLERWGVRHLRALAALPEVAVTERLGQEGLRLQKLARGELRRPLIVAEPPLVFEEAVELEYPVETLEPLAFLLNRMLEQLCARLAARALAANELRLRFELDVAAHIENPLRRHGDTEEAEGPLDCARDRLGSRVDGDVDVGGNHKSQITNQPSSASPCLRGEDIFFTRTLRLPVPMLDAKVFLKLLQLDLQAHPPSAPAIKVWLRVEPAEPRRMQNGLFMPQAPEAERLSVTLARIERVVGKSTADGPRSTAEPGVGSPEILDTHRPDGFRMKPFAASGQGALASGQPAGEDARPTPVSSITALRVLRPPLPAFVTVREGKPAHLASPERPTMRGEVVWCAGPWQSSGEWWSEQVWSRQEWDVAVRNEEGITLYRIYRDEIGNKWFVQGSYD